MSSSWGIYVHVPWCRIQCPYCAFHVVPGDAAPPEERFVRSVLSEAERRRDAFPGRAQTLFFGGGTPSRLSPKTLGQIIRRLPLASKPEISMEANPEDLNEEVLERLLDVGVSRISVGIQSLSESRARRLGRFHTLAKAKEALALLANSSLVSWSADLIFGLPDSTTEDLREDLTRLLAYDPPHVSVYGLTIEDGTPFASAVARGRMTPLPDEDWRAQYDLLVGTLHASSVERYEVSNFARAGHECLHNDGYWTDRPYMGLGPSAHGFSADGTRYRNRADTKHYLSGMDPTAASETPTRAQAAMDYVTSAIRSRRGVQLSHLESRHRFHLHSAIVDQLSTLGFLQRDEGRVYLSHEGFPIADTVASRLVEGLRDVTG